MKNLSIFEPQIEKHHAYKKKHLIKGLKKIGDFLVFWQKEFAVKLLSIVENSGANYFKSIWTVHIS